MDHDIAQRMAGRHLEPQPIFEREIVIDKFRLPATHDRQHAVFEGEAMQGILAALLDGVPMVVFAPRHDVAVIRKGRHRAAVVEPRVPTDVVPVEMGAQHIIDSLGEVGKIMAAQPMELRPLWSLFVVAEAGIDQDRVLRSLDDEAVERKDQLTGRPIDEPRTGQIRVWRAGPPDRSPEKRFRGR
jgi:hypothetical protein